MDEVTTDLVVLGAGPAGIGAAHRAAQAGMDVTVVERLDAVGGAARSIDVAGVACDLGSHRLHRAIDPVILARLRELLGSDLQERQRRGRIRLGGRWLPFPLRPVATLAALAPGFALSAGLDAVTAPLRRATVDTFDGVVRAGLGATMADRFYGPYARKLWGMEPTAISGDQARRRIGAATPGAVMARILRGADPSNRTFLYPRRGFGQTWEALAGAAVAAGARLALATTVTAVASDPDGVTVTTTPTAADDGRDVPGAQPRGRSLGGQPGPGADRHVTTIRARRVWSTLPLPLLARLHDPSPSPEVVTAARALRTRAMLLVYVVLDVDRWTDHDAHYLPEAWTPITRISEPKNYRDGYPGPDDPGDPPGRTILCAELPCEVGDRYWQAGDVDLARLVTDTIARAGLSCPEPVAVTTRRLRNAYPVTPVGYEVDLAVVDAWAASRPNLLTFGRQGLFVHDNSHHALAMAWAAGDALDVDGTFDAAAWDRARAGFADHVVED